MYFLVVDFVLDMLAGQGASVCNTGRDDAKSVVWKYLCVV